MKNRILKVNLCFSIKQSLGTTTSCLFLFILKKIKNYNFYYVAHCRIIYNLWCVGMKCFIVIILRPKQLLLHLVDLHFSSNDSKLQDIELSLYLSDSRQACLKHGDTYTTGRCSTRQTCGHDVQHFNVFGGTPSRGVSRDREWRALRLVCKMPRDEPSEIRCQPRPIWQVHQYGGG